MKLNLFLLILLFVFNSNLFADDNPDHNFCCEYIDVTVEQNDSCCLQITVSNPECLQLAVDISQLDESTNDYESEYLVALAKGNTLTYTICKKNYQTSIKYRIRLVYAPNPGEPACTGDFTEGTNQFSGEVDLTNCCTCPIGRNDWINITVYKDRECPNGGCSVLFGPLNIPEDISCYSHYAIEKVGEFLTSPKDIQLEPIKDTKYCIGENDFVTFKLYLFSNGVIDFNNACVIEKTLGCLGAFDPDDTLGTPCTPDCLNSAWIPMESEIIGIDSDCQVKVYYQTRIACPPLNYQDLQVTRIDILGCYGKSREEIYKSVVNELIKRNEMNFYPKAPNYGCSETWRILNASCWQLSYYINKFGIYTTSMHPCSTSVCCAERYKVCRDILDNVTIESLGTSIVPENIDCPLPPPLNDLLILNYPPYSSLQCYAACNWIKLDTLEQNFFKGIESLNNDILIIDNKLYITCKNNSQCNLYIEFIDILGNVLANYNENLKSANNIIDIKSLIKTEGFYLYKIYIDGSLFQTGKLIK